jgi:hypothetical protein
MLFNSSRIRKANAVAMNKGIKAHSVFIYSHMLHPVRIRFQGCKKTINRYIIISATLFILALRATAVIAKNIVNI